MIRIILSITIGTLILFVWNAISWMVLPFHPSTLNSIPEATFVRELLKENLPKDGVYYYPVIPNNKSTDGFKELEKKLNEGPRITLTVYKKGETDFFNPKSFILKLVFNL